MQHLCCCAHVLYCHIVLWCAREQYSIVPTHNANIHYTMKEDAGRARMSVRWLRLLSSLKI